MGSSDTFFEHGEVKAEQRHSVDARAARARGADREFVATVVDGDGERCIFAVEAAHFLAESVSDTVELVPRTCEFPTGLASLG
jgi:hypothetical protein